MSTFDASAAAPEDIEKALKKDGRVALRGVLFETDSDRLSEQGKSATARLVTVLEENPALKVAVVGHTDSSGPFRYNLDLSQRRARSMARELTAAGISADRVAPVGVGEIAPAADNNTSEGQAQNRRVEVVLIE